MCFNVSFKNSLFVFLVFFCNNVLISSIEVEKELLPLTWNETDEIVCDLKKIEEKLQKKFSITVSLSEAWKSSNEDRLKIIAQYGLLWAGIGHKIIKFLERDKAVYDNFLKIILKEYNPVFLSRYTSELSDQEFTEVLEDFFFLLKEAFKQQKNILGLDGDRFSKRFFSSYSSPLTHEFWSGEECLVKTLYYPRKFIISEGLEIACENLDCIAQLSDRKALIKFMRRVNPSLALEPDSGTACKVLGLALISSFVVFYLTVVTIALQENIF